LAENLRDGPEPGYEVGTCSALTEQELAECVEIIRKGGAVDADWARQELPCAKVVVARRGNRIVGLGAIKRVRAGYAAGIAEKSGVDFDTTMPELGYIAVAPEHRRQGLSHLVVAKLLSLHDGGLFATTDEESMKKTLSKAGFVERGRAWKGKRGQLSLWIRDLKPAV